MRLEPAGLRGISGALCPGWVTDGAPIDLHLLGMLLEGGRETAMALRVGDEVEIVGAGGGERGLQGGDAGIADGTGGQGGGELGEGVPVAGEQVAGAGFGLGQQGGDFLVEQPLGVLGVAALGQRGVPAGGPR